MLVAFFNTNLFGAQTDNLEQSAGGEQRGKGVKRVEGQNWANSAISRATTI